MRKLFKLSVLAAALTSAAAAQTVNQAPASTALPDPPVVKARPAPAFKAGEPVTDAAGVTVGTIKTLTESDQGPVVVVEIDAKLVGVRQSTLKLAGDHVVSSQTKAQMLAAAGAPR